MTLIDPPSPTYPLAAGGGGDIQLGIRKSHLRYRPPLSPTPVAQLSPSSPNPIVREGGGRWRDGERGREAAEEGYFGLVLGKWI